ALGTLFAIWGIDVLLRTAPAGLPRLDEVRLNSTVLLFALGVSLLTGVLFGLLPALRLYRIEPNLELKSGSRAGSDRTGGRRIRGLLVAAQVALCTLLLVVSGLLLGSFLKVINVDKGFEVEHLASIDVILPVARYPQSQDRNEFFRRLLEGVKTVSGIQSAAVVTTLPLRGTGLVNLVTMPGDVRPILERPVADYRFVSPDYFKTLGIPLRRGRVFSESDRNRRVAVISAHTAQRLWPGENPIGRTFHEGDNDHPLNEIVGVVADVRAVNPRADPGMMIYWQRGQPEASLIVRTHIDPESLAAAVHREIRELDSEIPVPQLRSMRQVVSDSVANRRFQVSIVLLFALVAVVLASIGIFGVASFAVMQRTGEIGIRMALGAQPSQVRFMILREGFQPVLLGLTAGVAAALAAGQALRTLLFGVGPSDPLIVTAALTLLTVVALAASYLPAQRATRIDPVAALRCE
ncbi:MAG: FtsX-like permease family protein, partial [Bryobacteraceae bacterium]